MEIHGWESVYIYGPGINGNPWLGDCLTERRVNDKAATSELRDGGQRAMCKRRASERSTDERAHDGRKNNNDQAAIATQSLTRLHYKDLSELFSITI